MSATNQTSGGLFAASLEVRHECPVGDLSREFPDLQIFQWAMNRGDVFQAYGPNAQLEGFRDAVVSRFGGRQVYSTAEGTVLVTESPASVPGSSVRISDIMTAVGVWEIPPSVNHGGWESRRVIAWTEGSLREMFAGIRKVGEVRLTSLRPIENLEMEKMMLMPASDIFAGLTDKQCSALLLGLRHGYYSMPSGTDIRRLADGAGLSASTFGEHLRKAEARILQNLTPYLEGYSLRTPGEVAVAEVRDVAVPRTRERDAPTRGRAAREH